MEKVKQQTYDLEVRLIEYLVRIIINDILEETLKMIKIFITSTESAEEKLKNSFNVRIRIFNI
jgi:hypothetical protein